MSIFEVLERRGTWVLLKFAATFAVFMLLHLLRIPLVLVARVLEVCLRRLNGFAARLATAPPRGPVNQFFQPSNGLRGEAVNVHA
ncbi:hypothetical protein LWP59_27530 [Amycolatopsis acidiphila]|uniref:Uncharacterized protein n=1 Tax=Amycolatopsis acidiphila TaxID=715473 RepID=A0A558A132_9PSEU|nr:hypothetical protein [Amycolatopsis acidiphila]TVT17967.1 hypothetical protein FNH06_29540 [Amycolatopsis acidiphila]UIJ57868.1 hypothetical protein LWP59_27530 [Amycolatopsis acidiphila]